MTIASRHAGAALVLVLLAVVPTWPLVQQLSTSLPGEGIGDNVAFLWNFWWMRQAGTSFFFASGLFAPYGVDLALHTHTALQGAVAATLLGRLDVVTAQNVVIIATLVLNGLCTYAFAWNRTRSIGGALVAGAIVAASPFVSAHLLGHFNLINVWPIPLAILASLRALETQSMKWSIAAGVMLAVLAYTDYYYLVYCLVVLAGLVLWRTGILAVTFHPRSLSRRARFALLVPLVLIAALSAAIVMSGGVDTTFAGVRVRASQPGNLLAAGWLLAAVAAWKRWRPSMRLDRTRWHDVVGDLQTFLPGAAAFAVLVSPILVHATVLVAAGDYSAPAHKWRSGPGGIDLLTLFIGSPFNAATGRWTQSVYDALGLDRMEGMGWIGVVPTAALVWATRRAASDRSLRPLVACAWSFFVWSLGPWLRIGGVSTGLLLPANLFGLVPILSNARIPGRALVMVILSAALLAARFIA